MGRVKGQAHAYGAATRSPNDFDSASVRLRYTITAIVGRQRASDHDCASLQL